tara:strand:- start:11668 stop:12441 length:774 start_codon:yes stop_codon:yes gene_type:complete
MKTVIIISKKDIAGMNILNFINLDNVYVIEDESIFHENIDKEIDADLFIFATKHQGRTGVKTLSCHTPGNWSVAEYGGSDKKLCVAPVNFLREAFVKLEEINNSDEFKALGYDVVTECTHHGPYLEKPIIYIEIGATEEEWRDEKARQIIASVVEHLVNNADEINSRQCVSAIAIGGLHTMPNFKKVILGSGVSIGHCCPKYMLEHLDIGLLRQAVDKSFPKASLVVIDWKGLGPYKEKVTELCEELGLEVKRTKEF